MKVKQERVLTLQLQYEYGTTENELGSFFHRVRGCDHVCAHTHAHTFSNVSPSYCSYQSGYVQTAGESDSN